MNFGKIFERQMLGTTKGKKQPYLEGYSEKRKQEVLRALKEGGYLPYRESLEIAKRIQPFDDPSDPDAPFANDLHALVAEKLKLKDYSQLKFYTAVDSPLDYFHGVDAFFEYYDELRKRSLIVTLDLTSNEEKSTGYKADVVMTVPYDGLDRQVDKEEYFNHLRIFTEHIEEVITQKKYP